MNKQVKKLLEKAKELGWNVDCEDGNVYYFSKYSPYGQDFGISVDTENDPDLFLDNLCARLQDYDPESETMLWLDEDGHGKNGAPYHMRDVLEDMEACEEMLENLYIGLHNYYKEEL